MQLTRRRALIGGATLASFACGTHAGADPLHVAVTKGPGCECCDGWAKHLRANGYSVSVTESDELDSVKEKLGIPADLRTCHTGQLGSYLMEGQSPRLGLRICCAKNPKE